jgi:IS30 family transposase
VHRYGLLRHINIDLGSNFNNHQFWEYCENSGINVWYVSVAHPRANGQVECANGMVLDALKKRLHDTTNTKRGKWVKKLPNTLWGFVLSLPNRQGSRLTSWSTASNLSYLPT